ADNLVPVWQDPAAPHYCSNPLMEVADPLETLQGYDVTLSGRSYRVPDIAFLSWFAGPGERQSVNGWYSFRNVFASPASSWPVFTTYGYWSFDIAGVDATVFTGINNNHQVSGYYRVGNALGSFLLSNVDPLTGSSITGIPVYVPGSTLTVAM